MTESDAVPGVPASGAEQATPDGTPHHHPQPLAWPTLSTPRLSIELLTEVYDTHLDALNDRYHMRFSEQRRVVHTKDIQRVYISTVGDESEQPEQQWMTLLDLKIKQGHTLGSMSCRYDQNNRVANIGIMIIPSMTAKFYGYEAWFEVMSHLLKHDYKVEAGCRSDHTAMRRIMERSGMLHEGTLLDHFLLEDGSRANCLLYGRCP